MNHIVIDDFAAPTLVRSLTANWLPPESGFWHLYENGKRATKDADRLPKSAQLLLESMATIDVKNLLGLADVFADVDYLHGAGMHQIDAGHSLGLHLDSERHPTLPWKREASAVLYLNDVDGGALEFCDSEGNTLDRIEPKTNRLVLFATSDQWHRVSQCHSERISLCLFFWSLHDGGSATRATFI